MIKLRYSSHKIDIVFVLALFTIFVATAFIAVLIGAKQYQSTADNMNYNYEVRTVTSYLEEKIRQNDSADGITVGVLPCSTSSDISALYLTSTENETNYITYIYYYDNYLREIFIKEGASFSPEAGQALVEIRDFRPTLLGSGLLKVTFTATDNLEYPVYLVLHSNSGKEAQ